MSHFTTLVIGSNVDEQLARYHEFECTGEDNQYVVDIDETKEAKAQYKKSKEKKQSFIKFVEDWYGRSVVPFGEEPNLAEKHKYGYVLLNAKGNVVKIVKRTNPSAKWDWYQVGGRWQGFFKLKLGVTAVLGKPGLQRTNPGYKPPTEDYADQCMKGDVDFEGMRSEAAEAAAKKYDTVHGVIDPLPAIVPWEDLLEKHGKNIEDARTEYHSQSALKALYANEETRWINVNDFCIPRDEFINNARKKAFSTFAVLKDGTWYERGSMGWWGCVSDEKDDNEWSRQFSDLVDSLPDNTLLTIVDCHI